MTDPRAVAVKLLGKIAVGPRDSAEFYVDLIVKALADERRRALEEAAGLCEAEALIDDERGYYGKEMAKAIRAKAIE